ncbi:hypothetical protein GUITHDRAFT_143567 [Guillardia theta CCMP2712]|uniref:Protein kinase domain-containing protein n=1 Tax=Guillardia theta (strain CCMP2712) TaxID=905079 RepID=L1IU58_GUITC|nr:hypothetical protein GUITHDRAFT_143567 [Guillardia theta CCMP2712]EKX39370.1 hypothetical protein GUITHDRAFT_143567 [Guillardia theta CCMP2712]|eukprot:XP_005826350.1 hypothetical protein GUITHDRAFT_143567 [Guillardia theta CCMP2712]
MAIFMHTRGVLQVLCNTPNARVKLLKEAASKIFGYKKKEPTTADLPIPRPPSEEGNVHPFERLPWWYRLYIVARRAVYLVIVFAPFTAVSLVQTLNPNDPWLREYWLEMMVKTLEKAGCSFMKFGQWLSMRPDLFPPDVIRALSRLRNDGKMTRRDAPSHDFEYTRKAIEESFGRTIEELFDEFDKVPVASGTIAQVHKGVLKPEFALEGGQREVAVKVRHPQVVHETYYDTRLLFDVLDWVGKTLLQTSQPFDKVDLTWEAYNLQLFNWNFQGEEIIKFPQVFPHLVSPSVLTETWVNGTIVQDIFSEVGDKAKATYQRFRHDMTGLFLILLKGCCCSDEVHATKKKMAQVDEQSIAIFDMNMKMFLRDNYIHGDLHGGNLMAAHDGTLAVFDAGLTTALNEDIAQPFGYFLHSICTGRSDKVSEKLITFNTIPKEKIDTEAFNNDLSDVMKQYVGHDSMHSPEGVFFVHVLLSSSDLTTLNFFEFVVLAENSFNFIPLSPELPVS